MKKGFTILELLIVISIIGVLSTIAVVTVNSAREKSRDARRIADLVQISKALELYYDRFGEYPNQENYPCSSGALGSCPAGEWIPDLVDEGFMDFLPDDPGQVGGQPPWVFTTVDHTYHYSSFDDFSPTLGETQDNQYYQLMAHLENDDHEEACVNKCWPFYTDDGGSDRIGNPWCPGACGGESFNPAIFVIGVGP